MANETAKIDGNNRWTSMGVTNDVAAEIRNLRMNPVTGRLIVEAVITSNNTGIGNTIPGGTEGSILFLGPGSTLAEDNANLFWDDTQNFMGIGTNTPSASLHVDGSVRFDLGGDATGDIFYRDASGDLINLPIGNDDDVLTVVLGIPTWVAPTAFTGYNRIQDDGVNFPQWQILNFEDFFTVTDDPGDTRTNVSINVTELANDTTFVTALVNNNTFTTLLANDNNFITELTNNTTFQNSIITIINNAGPTLQIDLTTQVTGVLPVPNGGTGAATLTGIVHGNGTAAMTAIPLTTDGAILIGDGATAPTTLNAFTSSTGVLKLVYGGTGASLADPGVDSLWGWDDTDGSIVFFNIGSGLNYDHATHTLTATGGGSIDTSVVVMEDEFLGGKTELRLDSLSGKSPVGQLNWTVLTNSGGGNNGSVEAVSGVTNHPGIIQLVTGGITNRNCAIVLGAQTQFNAVAADGEQVLNMASSAVFDTSIGPMNQGNYRSVSILKAVANSTVRITLGFVVETAGTSPSTITDGIYFELDTAVDANWRGKCTAASTTTTAGSTVASDTNFHKFEIVQNVAGTSVEFFIDGVSLGSVATNIPSAAGQPFHYIEQLAGTTRRLQIDYWALSMPGLTR